MFKEFMPSEFKAYISGFNFKRKITLVQLHHTYKPSYKDFKGNNHQAMQQAMKNYHVNSNGWNDIGQNLTIFPDGKILMGRDLNLAPAGIYGANTNGICIECVGNFDAGGDDMKEAQKNAIVEVIKILNKKFNLNAENSVTYHAWWTADGKNLGDYYKKLSAKTCPGTNFFGGNTFEAFNTDLLPLIKGEQTVKEAVKELETINDIVWELHNKGIISNKELWLKKLSKDTNDYWLARKCANYLRGIK